MNRFRIGSHFAMMKMHVIPVRFRQRVDFDIPADSIDEVVPAVTSVWPILSVC